MLPAPAVQPSVVQPAPVQPPLVQTSRGALAFKDAPLGMSLAAWKAAPFPAAVADVRPVCQDGGGAGPIGLRLSPAERRAGAVACTYAFVGPDGPDARKPIPLDGAMMARDVRYVFEQGRLARVDYTASVDAFDDIVARITAQVGAPSEVIRDRVATPWGVSLPRVRMRWKSPAGWATLTDPVAAGGRLSVTYETPELGRGGAAARAVARAG